MQIFLAPPLPGQLIFMQIRVHFCSLIAPPSSLSSTTNNHLLLCPAMSSSTKRPQKCNKSTDHDDQFCTNGPCVCVCICEKLPSNQLLSLARNCTQLNRQLLQRALIIHRVLCAITRKTGIYLISFWEEFSGIVIESSLKPPGFAVDEEVEGDQQLYDVMYCKLYKERNCTNNCERR